MKTKSLLLLFNLIFILLKAQSTYNVLLYDNLNITKVGVDSIVQIDNEIELNLSPAYYNPTKVALYDNAINNINISPNMFFSYGVKSPFNNNTWVYLEKTSMGSGFYVWLFNTFTNTKQQLFFNDVGIYGYKPIAWGTDSNTVYFEKFKFDNEDEHAGIIKYNLQSGEITPLYISSKYMTSPVISPDGRYLAYTVSSDVARDLVHGLADKLYVYDLQTNTEASIYNSSSSTSYILLGWNIENEDNLSNVYSSRGGAPQFKLPWLTNTSYCVSRNGTPAPPNGCINSVCPSTHSGAHTYTAVDFTNGAISGGSFHEDILAAAPGTVIFIQNNNSTTGYGNYVKIRHTNDDNTIAYYGHLTSVCVNVGDYVIAGQKIGNEGTSGSSSGEHLHFELRTSGDQNADLYPEFIEYGCTPLQNYRYTSANTYTACGSTIAFSCDNPILLNCGVTYNGGSSSAPSTVYTYGCNNWTESGPERVHRITTTQTGTLTATISNFTGDLDVYILGSCDPSNCLGTVSSSSATYVNAPPGTYYIVVDSDDGSGSGYSLIVNCATNTPNQPDLSVINPTLSFGPFCAGNTITTTCNIANNGTSQAGTSILRYYLSTNTTYDGNDILLSSSNVSVINAGGTSSIISQSLIIPLATTPGSYYILFYADAANSVSESNENNNISNQPLIVNNCSSQSADLVITNIDFSTNSQCAGSTITINYNVGNIGNSNAGASTVKYYLSSNNTYSINDVLLATTSISSINANTSISRTATVTIPSGTSVGPWYILIVADADNAIAEGTNGEANNTSSDNITVNTCNGLADIELTYDGNPPTSGIVGNNIPANFTCENIGSVFAPGSRVGYYISTDNVLDPLTDVYIDYEGISSLDPNESDVETSNFEIPDCFACGSYYIIMVADYLNVVAESNESNNIYVFPFTITGCITCSIQVPSTGISFLSSGGTGNISVTAYECCQWTATTNDSWITIINGFDYGNGTVNYSVDPCSGGGTRTGTITVDGQTHTITQNCAQSCNASQSFEWGAQAGSTTLSDAAADLAIDASGNLYMTGDIQGSASFGNGITLTTPSNAPDIFVSKHNSSGIIQWAVRYGNTDQEEGLAIATDNSGNVYVAGYFENSVTFGGTTLTSNATDEYAAFVIKLNSSGTIQWAKKINSTYNGRATGITIDASGNIIVYGVVNDYTGNTGESFFIAKYNSAGTQTAYTLYGTSTIGLRYSESISNDSQNNIYITGRYSNSLTLGGITLTGNINTNGFIAKLNSTGTVLWAKNANCPTDDSNFKDITIDNAGDVYAIGYGDDGTTIESTSLVIPANTRRPIIAKFGSSGNFIWAKTIPRGSAAFNKIIVSTDNKLYITGYFSNDTLQYDNILIPNAGSGDGLLMRLNSSGSAEWVKGFGGALDERGFGIVKDNTDNIFVAGGFRGTVVFGSTTLTSNGSEDIYLAKFKQCDPPVANITNTGNLNVCNGQTVLLSTNYCNTNTYQWQLNSNDIQGATNPTYTASVAGIYRVKVSAFAGCETYSGTLTVTVNSITTPTITGNTSVCNSQTTLFNAGSGYTSYLWSNGASTQTTSLGVGNHYVTVTGSNGCQATAYVVVTQQISPSANISYSNNGLTYNFLSNQQDNPTTYSWQFGDGGTSNQENPAHTYAQAGTYNVTLTVTNNCGSNTYQETVTIGSTCNYSLSPNIIVCDSTGSVTTINITTGDGCNWSVNTGDCSWLTIQPLSGSGASTVTVTIPATNDTFVKNCNFVIEGLNIPVTQYGKLGGLECFPIDTSVAVANSDLAANNIPNATYLWYRNGVPIPNTNSRFYTATQNGFYYVQISIGNCVYTSGDHYITVSNIGEISPLIFNVFPNPNNGSFTISAELIDNKDVQIMLYTTLGQLIYNKTIVPVSKKLNEEISIINQPAGVYYLQILGDNKSYYKKVVLNNR